MVQILVGKENAEANVSECDRPNNAETANENVYNLELMGFMSEIENQFGESDPIKSLMIRMISLADSGEINEA